MADALAGTNVLITVTGPDRPGVSSVLFAALTRHGVDLLDVEQVVVRGHLTLGALVAVHRDPDGLREAVEQAMATIAMQVHTSVETGDDPSAPRRNALGCEPVDVGLVAAQTEAMAGHAFNGEEQSSMSQRLADLPDGAGERCRSAEVARLELP